jgi:leader peptidase (prepilin peptidase) / N-methyltransferase
MISALDIGATAAVGTLAGCTLPVLSNIAAKIAMGKDSGCHAAGGAVLWSAAYRMRASVFGCVALALACLFVDGWTSKGGCVFGFLFVLYALAAIDGATLLLPDILTIPLMLAGLAVNASGTLTSFSNASVGAVAGYLILWLMYWCVRLVTGKEGLGYGDFKLAAAVGAWLGFVTLLHVIAVAVLLAGIYVGLRIFRGRLGADRLFPFGPFLAASAAASTFFGAPLYVLFSQ